MRGRRVVFSGQRQTAWEQFEVPEPGPHEVLIKTSWSAVSVGTETAIYSGTHIGFSIPGATYPRYPAYPGYAAVGTVLAVGAEAHGFAPGQVVCYAGRHGSHAVWDSRRPPMARLPAGLAPDLAALARLGTISLNGVRLGNISVGDRVAVLGAGLIGQFAAQLARLSGGRPVVVADFLADRLRAAQECGLQAVVNPAERDVLAVGRSLSRDRGFDVVVEATGAPGAVAQALTLVADFGRVVLLGSPRGRVEIDPYTHIHRPGVTIVGAHERTTPSAESVYSHWTQQRNFELVLDLLQTGDLIAAPLISHRLPASQAADVYEDLVLHPDRYLGVVFDWGGEDERP
ncbi:MAG: zinc-binding alcohol dehydrogenase [Chloroflexi bacterium]|nr:zinc-binding alcohol dehydrogenase [Chloroflexota bacterium]